MAGPEAAPACSARGLKAQVAVDIDQIPGDASVVAGYVSGDYVTFSQLSVMFPHARHLSIAVTAEANAGALDVEPGDAVAGQVPAWYRPQKARGVARPVIYASVSLMATGILPVLRQAGISRSDVRLWSAHYTYAEHLCGPGSCAAKANCGVHLGRPGQPGRPGQEHAAPRGGHHPAADRRALARGVVHRADGDLPQWGVRRRQGEGAEEHHRVPPKRQRGRAVQQPRGSDLLGLSLAVKCQPSAMVQLTAEKSPSAMFSAGMAQYLDDVFGRSATKVPDGIHLFYEK